MNIIDGKPVLDVAISGENMDALRAKVALFDVLAAQLETGKWNIMGRVDGVEIIVRQSAAFYLAPTLAEAIEKAMEAEGGDE